MSARKLTSHDHLFRDSEYSIHTVAYKRDGFKLSEASKVVIAPVEEFEKFYASVPPTEVRGHCFCTGILI